MLLDQNMHAKYYLRRLCNFCCMRVETNKQKKKKKMEKLIF